MPAQLHHQFGRRLIVRHFPQLEIPRRPHIRELSPVDPVSVQHDRTLPRLAENFGQPHDRRRLGPDDVLQHRARAHSRQLVHITDQHHPAAFRRRPQQIIHHEDIHHRHFIHDDHIGINRVFFAPPEHRPAAPRSCRFQQAVHRQRLASRRFRQPFGRPSRRRGQRDLAALHRQHVQHRLHSRRFACARPPRHHQHAVAARREHRLALRPGQLDPFLAFELRRHRRHIRHPERFRRIPQLDQTLRHLAFRMIQVVGIYQRPAARFLHRQRTLPEQLRQHLRHFIAVAPQLLHRRLHQNFFRHAGMTGVRRTEQRVADACRDPREILRLRAAGQRDPVGDAEPDAVDLAGQPVGVLLDHLHGLIAIHSMNPSRIGPGNAVGFEKEHQFTQFGLGRERLHDHRQLLGADSFDLQQMPGLALQNIHRFQPEPRHHALGHGRSDALDCP